MEKALPTLAMPAWITPQFLLRRKGLSKRTWWPAPFALLRSDRYLSLLLSCVNSYGYGGKVHSRPAETWPTQEFTYLEPGRCVDTTVAQRREWVDAYWSRSDPAFRDGLGAESFLDFISRAQSLLDRLSDHPAQDIVVFSHGQLINAVAWLIECTPQRIDGRAMADWREYEIANHVPNCSGYTLSKYREDTGWKICRSEQQIEVTHRVPGRSYQAVRDLERLLVEERAQEFSAKGYPLQLDDDSAMYTEQRLNGVRGQLLHPK